MFVSCLTLQHYPHSSCAERSGYCVRWRL